MGQVPNTSQPTPLEQISVAAQFTDRWLPAADLANNVLKNEAWRSTHPSAGDWIVDAAHQAKYSVNAFRRQMRVAEFVRNNVDAKTWPDLLQRNMPFGNLEVLRRLFDSNPEQARSLLPEIIHGDRTYRSMRELYHKSQERTSDGSGRKIYVNRTQQFVQQAEECIKSNLSTFLGVVDPNATVEFRQSPRGFFYARPELLLHGWSTNAQGVRAPAFVDAFEIKLFGVDDSKQILIRTLEQVALLENFFRKIWLIYPSISSTSDSHERHIQELGFHLIALGMDSVGVALVPPDQDAANAKGNDPFEIRRLPKPNPNPSRWHLLTSYLRNQ